LKTNKKIKSGILLPVTLLFVLFSLPVIVSAEREVTVVNVYDGDTLIVSDDSRALIIKLFGIDCPEKRQPFGLKAKRYTSKLVVGEKIRIISVHEDRYLECKVYIGGKCINEELLKAGLAWHNNRDCSNNTWANLANKAAVEGKGLWSQTTPVSPWEFRKKKSKPIKRSSRTIKFGGRHRRGGSVLIKRRAKR
jgi:endonuclease YncB( thermonuclease family)